MIYEKSKEYSIFSKIFTEDVISVKPWDDQDMGGWRKSLAKSAFRIRMHPNQSNFK